MNNCKNEDETIQTLPKITTIPVTDISMSSATCGGIINSDGGAKITEQGVCWSLGNMPTIADKKIIDNINASSFKFTLKGLSPSTTYYIRAYATNKVGTTYGNILVFKTLDGVIDIDGNTYPIIKIGFQVWMAENLKVTHFNNGDIIPNITDNSEWIIQKTGALCNYNNDQKNHEIYGSLYNFYAVSDQRGLCPEGWHVPDYSEWQSLVNFLGGKAVAAGKLKQSDTTFWHKPNVGATNESGFTSIPAGYRNFNDGSFDGLGFENIIWMSLEISDTRASAIDFYNTRRDFDYISGPKTTGLTIRCIRNE
jgi:uncharacterized protein (TIGR02145 family)